MAKGEYSLLEKLTVKDIKEKLLNIQDLDDSFIKKIQCDERKGVQELLVNWNKRYQQNILIKEKFYEMTRYERVARNKGYHLICGIDEVGRGPLAGPVVASSVILPEDFYLPGLDDSKKLSKEKRETYYKYIQEQAVAIGIGKVEAAEIDAINIYEATKKAMLTSIRELTVQPDYVLVDAMKLDTPYPTESIIKGDSKSISIAAASVIAKVTRDRIMEKADEEYPGYHFSKNMGYGTKEHYLGLERIGISPYHRKSFAPIKDMILC